MYSTGELQQLHRAGKAYKLRSGAILPTNTAQETATAIQQAKNAHRTGRDDDDPGFRAHLIGRAAAHGLQRAIPATWGDEQAGKSASRWDWSRVARETRDAVYEVAKRAGCDVQSMDIEMTTPVERAEASRRASECTRRAALMPDPIAADGYRQMAKEAREVLTGRKGHLAKAQEYEGRSWR
jgi:hypothetical protein